MDSSQFLYSIPIFLMSRYGELCFEHEFRNPADKYWYVHPLVSQDLSELYRCCTREKTALLRPELYSTSPSYIKYNLYSSSDKFRKNCCFLGLRDIPEISIWGISDGTALKPANIMFAEQFHHLEKSTCSTRRIEKLLSDNANPNNGDKPAQKTQMPNW